MRWTAMGLGAVATFAAAHDGPHEMGVLGELVTPDGVVSVVDTGLGQSLEVDGRVARLPAARQVGMVALVTAEGRSAALLRLEDGTPCGLRHALVRLDDLRVTGPFGACGAHYLGGGPEGTGWQLTVGEETFVYDGTSVAPRE